ncbi:hypothetical protein AXK12_00665 [Cephaloticoccus capnophilus]|uniref:PEP-CTERM protein-sorting domain-containing protein n=1 Tax=Cephaloticoccus capnophilus TaxID=1548208 RepID=A0A139SU58_9BACT|nr:PEP-CTERM sorting domain-containing protein [Cephaloticoccus capnophilus]KXU38054.1 hypothetical protein AXK12_00665 [Cephaloticoccus capnophilus]
MLPAPVVESYSEVDIHGLGTAVLEEDAPNFFGEVIISGAQLTLKDGGRLTNAWRVLVKNGGTLFLDNSAAAHGDRLGSTAEIRLNAGTLAFAPGDFGFLTQELSYLTLSGGANQIDLHLGSTSGGLLLAQELSRAATSTLNIRYIDPTNGSAAPINVRLEVQNWSIFTQLDILPWATITHGSQVDWAPWKAGGIVFNPFTNYYTGSPANWNTVHNVLIDSSTTTLNNPGGVTWVRSLKLANGGALILGGPGNSQILDLDSGGLLSTGSAGNQISGVGEIRLGFDFFNALLIHVHGGNLSVSGTITLDSILAPIIKTGEGTLRLNGDIWMQGGPLVINQGIVSFEKGKGMDFMTVLIGDGTGTDVLELPASHDNPITSSWDPSGWPSIVLHGTPYSTSPGSGAADAAILRFRGGTVQNAQLLHVEGRGMLDFLGGTVAKPNMLYLEEFTLADFDTTLLFIRHWEDGRDILLAHREKNKDRIDADFLARIKFEGYDAPAEWVYWGDGTYWEIRVAPEPHTYGAILGALGLGFFVWRKRKRGSANAASVRSTREWRAASQMPRG